MTRRSEIIAPKDVLRDMVLKRGGKRGPGAMGLTEILASREFRHGHENKLRMYVYQLRKQYKGVDMGHGTEAWELLDKVVIGLESRLSQLMRSRIQMRRHAKVRGVAEQTNLDNLVFEGRIAHNGVVHKKEIIRRLETSTKDLQEAASSSTTVRETLVEHKDDFAEA